MPEDMEQLVSQLINVLGRVRPDIIVPQAVSWLRKIVVAPEISVRPEVAIIQINVWPVIMAVL